MGRFEASPSEFEQQCRIPLWCEQPYNHLGNRCFSMFQAHGEALSPHVSASEVRGKVRGESAKRKQKCLSRLDFKVEFDPQLEGCGGQKEFQWQDLAAQHLIQVVEQADRKAARQLSSGKRKQLIELPQAHAAERLNDVRIKPKERHGQGTHRRTQTGVIAYR
ncbi:hypothetical protein NS337_20190 [Pseudomonas oryzihabitans]|nr:hypothetical protein NS337_20190 [Pseudomonas psychrotolerans]